MNKLLLVPALAILLSGCQGLPVPNAQDAVDHISDLIAPMVSDAEKRAALDPSDSTLHNRG